MIRTTIVPDKNSTRVTLILPDSYIGEEIEIVAYSKKEEAHRANSPALPGDRLSIAAFKTWLDNAETLPSISIEKARAQWASKKARLRKLIK